MHIVLRGEGRTVLCEAYGFISDSSVVLIKSDSSYTRTIFYSNKLSRDDKYYKVFIHNRRSADDIRLPASTHVVIALKNDSVCDFGGFMHTSDILAKTIYYRNGNPAITETHDSILYFNRRGLPVLQVYTDSVVVCRDNGSRQFLLKPNYRCYTNRRGRVISERFGDSLVRYDNAGKLRYYALTSNDSIHVFSDNGVTLFSGPLIMYMGFSKDAHFEVSNKREIKSGEDVLFLFLTDEVLFTHYRNFSPRIPDMEHLPGSPYPYLYSGSIFAH